MLRARLSKRDAVHLGVLLDRLDAGEISVHQVLSGVVELCGAPVPCESGAGGSALERGGMAPRAGLEQGLEPIADEELWRTLELIDDEAVLVDWDALTRLVENLLTTLIETRAPRSITSAMIGLEGAGSIHLKRLDRT